MQAASQLGVSYLTGVEISVSFLHQTVHIVGLGFDHHNIQLRDGLAQVSLGRQARARKMADALMMHGLPDIYEGALRLAGNPALISRAHLARYLVQIGVCASMQEVFRKFLTEGKPGFVPHCWASLGDAVRWILAAGGMAVIAHPARYRFTAMQEYALFSEFKQHGGLGVEVVTGSHHPSEYGKYADIVKEMDLLASRGSDFHDPSESRADLGTLNALPKGLPPVWDALQDKIVRPKKTL